MAKTKYQKKGENFEILIENILKNLGKHKVKRNNNIIKETRKNGKIRCQIDIIYGLIFKTYVECKYHKNDYVSLAEISKFYGVLELLKVKKGEMYTNTTYCSRAKEFAKNKKIKIYCGTDIKNMYKNTLPFIQRLFMKKINLEKLL